MNAREAHKVIRHNALALIGKCLDLTDDEGTVEKACKADTALDLARSLRSIIAECRAINQLGAEHSILSIHDMDELEINVHDVEVFPHGSNFKELHNALSETGYMLSTIVCKLASHRAKF
jgi:hypothetical protein